MIPGKGGWRTRTCLLTGRSDDKPESCLLRPKNDQKELYEMKKNQAGCGQQNSVQAIGQDDTFKIFQYLFRLGDVFEICLIGPKIKRVHFGAMSLLVVKNRLLRAGSMISKLRLILLPRRTQ
jgi:hypothetical protein